jgi:hypothetical protein
MWGAYPLDPDRLLTLIELDARWEACANRFDHLDAGISLLNHRKPS